MPACGCWWHTASPDAADWLFRFAAVSVRQLRSHPPSLSSTRPIDPVAALRRTDVGNHWRHSTRPSFAGSDDADCPLGDAVAALVGYFGWWLDAWDEARCCRWSWAGVCPHRQRFRNPTSWAFGIVRSGLTSDCHPSAVCHLRLTYWSPSCLWLASRQIAGSSCNTTAVRYLLNNLILCWGRVAAIDAQPTPNKHTHFLSDVLRTI